MPATTPTSTGSTSAKGAPPSAPRAPLPAEVPGWGSVRLHPDGTVSLPDLNLVLANFGQEGSAGDINGDCVVDLVDLNLLLANFGNFGG